MPYETLLYRKEEGYIGIVTLNRPQRLNAYSMQLIAELRSVYEEIERDDEVRVFLITGAPRPDGRPCFSVGADVKELAQTGSPFPGLVESLEGFVNPVRGEMADVVCRPMRMSKFSIAAIDGICTGGALPLALSCDVRVCAETALVSEMHMRNLGNIGAFTISQLARLVGPSRALLMMITGEEVDGNEARRIGFADRVFPSDKLLDGAKTLARTIAARRSDAVRAAKAVAYASMDLTRAQALSFDLIAGNVVFDDSTIRAMEAFASK